MPPSNRQPFPATKDIEAFHEWTDTLSPAERDRERQLFFNERMQPYWGDMNDQHRAGIREAWPSLKYPGAEGPQRDQGPFQATATKEALKPFQPGFSYSDMTSVLGNPKATYGEKAKAALGYASHYPDVITKAIAPPAFWRGHENEGLWKAFDFMPYSQAYNIVGAMGQDAGRAAGLSPMASMLITGALTAGRPGSPSMAMKAVGGRLPNALPALGAQAQSPILARILERLRGGQSAVPRGAPPIEMPGSFSPPGTTTVPPMPRVRNTPQGPVQLF